MVPLLLTHSHFGRGKQSARSSEEFPTICESWATFSNLQREPAILSHPRPPKKHLQLQKQPETDSQNLTAIPPSKKKEKKKKKQTKTRDQRSSPLGLFGPSGLRAFGPSARAMAMGGGPGARAKGSRRGARPRPRGTGRWPRCFDETWSPDGKPTPMDLFRGIQHLWILPLRELREK